MLFALLGIRARSLSVHTQFHPPPLLMCRLGSRQQSASWKQIFIYPVVVHRTETVSNTVLSPEAITDALRAKGVTLEEYPRLEKRDFIRSLCIATAVVLIAPITELH